MARDRLTKVASRQPCNRTARRRSERPRLFKRQALLGDHHSCKREIWIQLCTSVSMICRNGKGGKMHLRMITVVSASALMLGVGACSREATVERRDPAAASKTA